ncbi:FadR/GntR family transcriptional regulator [Paracoccus aminophilus]|uniref:Transcriptional regulator, GntR family n=1 Tax=Paracoccus aminophilus JCM 7686 TaxID=1367847 RepID=S5YFA6_PARAH|nr:FadR/GntR family transcriptional regulator [Paracoccus aminophilus]AGT10153.1 transcriptional regulator, GntR family [Paracoccus aminophilus JCM 7686]
MKILNRTLFGAIPATSHAKVVDALGRAIVAGELAEDEVLPGDPVLTARFDVSRTVLREAMKTLAAKGLIRAKSRVGTQVNRRELWNFVDRDVIAWRMQRGVDTEFVRQLSEMRLALEPATAALAARHATSDEIIRLYNIAARMDDRSHTRESFAEVDLEFHLAVAAMSRNPFIRSVSSLVEAALAVSFRISSPALSPERIMQSASTHLRIARVIADHDEEGAAAAMRQVIVEGAERACEALAREGGGAIVIS